MKENITHKAYQLTTKEIEECTESETDSIDEDSYSDDSFLLFQMKAKINLSQAKKRAHESSFRHMSKSVYQMIFNDPDVKYLADNDISLRLYTDHQAHILGKCQFYMLHLDIKKPHVVTFYVVSNEGSML